MVSATRFQLLSRPNCHLCQEMEKVLSQELPRWGERFSVEDVDADPEWQERFGEVIPVLLREGKPVAKIRLDRGQLERIVTRSRARTDDD